MRLNSQSSTKAGKNGFGLAFMIEIIGWEMELIDFHIFRLTIVYKIGTHVSIKIVQTLQTNHSNCYAR